jgi:hypothetical protein
MTIYDVFSAEEQVAILFMDGARFVILALKENREFLHHDEASARFRCQRWRTGRTLPVEFRENRRDHLNWLFTLGLGVESKDHTAQTPFAAIGGREQRLTPKLDMPDWVVCPDEDRRYFLAGYIAGAVLRYGVGWRTMKIE